MTSDCELFIAVSFDVQLKDSRWWLILSSQDFSFKAMDLIIRTTTSTTTTTSIAVVSAKDTEGTDMLIRLHTA